jgi:hypothetical protein
MPAGRQERQWKRGYPPLLLLGLATLVVVIVLPSSLNLPQSNPGAVLEYAPVPPQDHDAPVQSNLSTLGLGSSNTLATGAAKPPPPPPNLLKGVTGNPKQFHCYGKPPRQTEDPSSPPCVPFFQGDNFGSTYQGVTKSEITVLVYMDIAGYGAGTGLETSPPDGTYIDLDGPAHPACPADYPNPHSPSECDHVKIRELRALSRYFNSRFQMYGRHLHYWAYFSGAKTASARRGDAGANVERLHPFAVIDNAVFDGFNAEYDTAMNQLGVLSFGSSAGSLPGDVYRSHAPLSWGFYPDVEHWAQMYTTYLCSKVAPYPVSHFGNPQGVGAPNGQKRKYGLWYTTDASRPGVRLFAKLVKQDLHQCGITPVTERTYAVDGYIQNSKDNGSDGAQAAADFQAKGVTTVLYLGGMETSLTKSLDTIRYYPEIVVGGSLNNDGNTGATFQNQTVWANAWDMTFHIRQDRLEDSPGYRAYKEGNPNGDDPAGFYAEEDYRDHFMLAEGIQVAGPRLTAHSMSDGFHAIPEHTSNDPFSPALYFDPNDYTAMKDAQEGWWDPNGQPPGSTGAPGCWRLVNAGHRYPIGRWPKGDDAFRNRSDPCTGYAGGINIQESPPGT